MLMPVIVAVPSVPMTARFSSVGTLDQGMKKCKFPRKLIEISRGPKVPDITPL